MRNVMLFYLFGCFEIFFGGFQEKISMLFKKIFMLFKKIFMVFKKISMVFQEISMVFQKISMVFHEARPRLRFSFSRMKKIYAGIFQNNFYRSEECGVGCALYYSLHTPHSTLLTESYSSQR